MGAKKTFDDDVKAILFDSKHHPLKKTEVLRLRQIGTIVEFAYKHKLRGKYAGIKAVDELQVEVSELPMMLKILNSLGFIEKQRIDKHRISYELGKGQHVEIDTIYNPVRCPSYLEIEAGNARDLKRIVTSLGYTMRQTTDWSQTKVVEHYRSPRL